MTISPVGSAAAAHHAQALRPPQSAAQSAAKATAPLSALIDSDGDRDGSKAGGRIDIKA
jgi:hypothetical protein